MTYGAALPDNDGFVICFTRANAAFELRGFHFGSCFSEHMAAKKSKPDREIKRWAANYMTELAN